MIYGAYGYTGTLIAREAKRRGLTPILAGRNSQACLKLAAELGFEARIFSCDSEETISPHLSGVDLVLHCAGPFSSTTGPMLKSCLKAKAHYLDITGELQIFERVQRKHELISQAGIVAIPGVGFDVVPSDCLAAMLKEKLPDATHLSLAFKPSGKISPGTAKTMVEGLSQDGAIRKDGVITAVPAAYKVRNIAFHQEPQPAVTIAWGDVSTAFHSTGIPNVEVYLASSLSAIRLMKASQYLKYIAGHPMIQKFLKALVERFVEGPSDENRVNTHCILWGEVRNATGDVVEMKIKVPEAYTLTAVTALKIVEIVLSAKVTPGFSTPSQAFGSKFILDFDGVSLV